MSHPKFLLMTACLACFSSASFAETALATNNFSEMPVAANSFGNNSAHRLEGTESSAREGQNLETNRAPVQPRNFVRQNFALRVHDPSTIVRGDGEYWFFSTGTGILSRHSSNLVSWVAGDPVFEAIPKWVNDIFPGHSGGFWAPDVIRVKNRWLLYYSISRFGKRTSAIALASNATLDPTSKKFHWRDEGIVFQTSETNDFNAIDPSLLLDAKGKLWMAFGSFWSGIKLIQLDPKTGKRIAPDSPLYSLAHKKEIEASCLTTHDGWYYLFLDWGICCRGTDSTYEIRVGRSRKITGPYLDRDGRDMREGGGTLFLGSEGRFIGPGHAGILREGKNEYVSFHFYDGERSGRPALGIRKLKWSKAGWPQVGEWVCPKAETFNTKPPTASVQ